jgi:hypothetical protein
MRDLIAWVLRKFFPNNWVNNDTVGAIIAIAAVSLAFMGLLALAGCHGGAVYVKPYHHNSSIPEQRDANTSDRFGICTMYWLSSLKHSPQMHVCIDREFTKKPVFGHEGPDIVGDVQIHWPFYTWGKR